MQFGNECQLSLPLMGQTIAEKILSEHCAKKVKAGDVAVCKVDFCFGQDGTSGLIIDSFDRLGKKRACDDLGFCMFLDHNSPSPNQAVSCVHKRMRQFAHKMGVGIYDVGTGICHQLVLEEGYALPGELVLGADSHTCTYGALNAFATGVGSTDLALTLASGKNWFRVPETAKLLVSGKWPRGVYAKDLILYIIGDLGSDGCTYKSIEFLGEAIQALSVESRFTISNMAVEMGAKCGLMEADVLVEKWLKPRTKRKFREVKPDKDATYCTVKEYSVNKLGPQVAKPHSVDNVVPVDEVLGVEIDQAFLGTCTNGRLEDLEIGARILKDKKIHPKVKFIVAPASNRIFLEAAKKGLIEIFIKAGAAVISPGCGPCVGTGQGIPADGEVVISTANRNFKGRMGNPKAFIYLASPATVTASALKGKICDPRRYL